MSLIGKPAPEFRLEAVSLPSLLSQTVSLDDYARSWLLLLFFPRDFSFVCPTELTSFSARSFDFNRRNCKLLGISVDTIAMHTEWLTTPPAKGGLGPLQFPLASDQMGEMSKKYGIWLEEKEVSARGLFLIDPEGILQYSVVHNLSVGRNVDEILRVLDAMQHGGLCPASWTTADGTLDIEQSLQAGRVLGHYRIQRLLGEGTFGSVFQAWDLRLERHVALKVLKRNALESREAILGEARAAAALNHSHVCRIYAVEEEDGLPVIAMEYIEGRLLSDLISGSLPLDKGVAIARDVLEGLAAAHALHIVHGDLKPGNVIISDDDRPHILDFGLAQRASPSAKKEARTMKSLEIRPQSNAKDPDATTIILTVESQKAGNGLIKGTPAYMAPEQSRGDFATEATDVFAWGLMFYELLTGRRALSGNHLPQLILKLQDAKLAESLGEELPPRYREVLRKALTINPDSRATSAQLLDMLDQEL